MTDTMFPGATNLYPNLTASLEVKKAAGGQEGKEAHGALALIENVASNVGQVEKKNKDGLRELVVGYGLHNKEQSIFDQIIKAGVPIDPGSKASFEIHDMINDISRIKDKAMNAYGKKEAEQLIERLSEVKDNATAIRFGDTLTPQNSAEIPSQASNNPQIKR